MFDLSEMEETDQNLGGNRLTIERLTIEIIKKIVKAKMRRLQEDDPFYVAHLEYLRQLDLTSPFSVARLRVRHPDQNYLDIDAVS